MKLFRKLVRIAGGEKCLLRDLSGYLMVAMAIGRRAGKHGCDHKRSSHANDANDVRKYSIVTPLLEGFLASLR